MSAQHTFDATKLEVLHEEELPVTPNTSIVGRVYSYDGGEPRMKVLSRIMRKNGTKSVVKQFPPLTTAEQVSQVAELLERCRNFL
jgi:hypothetical protein